MLRFMQSNPEHLFASRIKEMRRERGWTQAEVAERAKPYGMDVHPTAITRVESGRRGVSLDEFFSLCLVFDWLPEEMVKSMRTEANLGAELEAQLGATQDRPLTLTERAESLDQVIRFIQTLSEDLLKRTAEAEGGVFVKSAEPTPEERAEAQATFEEPDHDVQ